MASLTEFVKLYTNATPEAQKAVREILELPKGHDKEAIRQILINNGIDQGTIKEIMAAALS